MTDRNAIPSRVASPAVVEAVKVLVESHFGAYEHDDKDFAAKRAKAADLLDRWLDGEDV